MEPGKNKQQLNGGCLSNVIEDEEDTKENCSDTISVGTDIDSVDSNLQFVKSISNTGYTSGSENETYLSTFISKLVDDAHWYDTGQTSDSFVDILNGLTQLFINDGAMNFFVEESAEDLEKVMVGGNKSEIMTMTKKIVYKLVEHISGTKVDYSHIAEKLIYEMLEAIDHVTKPDYSYIVAKLKESAVSLSLDKAVVENDRFVAAVTVSACVAVIVVLAAVLANKTKKNRDTVLDYPAYLGDTRGKNGQKDVLTQFSPGHINNLEASFSDVYSDETPLDATHSFPLNDRFFHKMVTTAAGFSGVIPMSGGLQTEYKSFTATASITTGHGLETNVMSKHVETEIHDSNEEFSGGTHQSSFDLESRLLTGRFQKAKYDEGFSKLVKVVNGCLRSPKIPLHSPTKALPYWISDCFFVTQDGEQLRLHDAEDHTSESDNDLSSISELLDIRVLYDESGQHETAASVQRKHVLVDQEEDHPSLRDGLCQTKQIQQSFKLQQVLEFIKWYHTYAIATSRPFPLPSESHYLVSPYSPSTLAMDREWCYADKALDSRTAELIGYLQQSYFRVFASADACCFTTGKLPASKRGILPCQHSPPCHIVWGSFKTTLMSLIEAIVSHPSMVEGHGHVPDCTHPLVNESISAMQAVMNGGSHTSRFSNVANVVLDPYQVLEEEPIQYALMRLDQLSWNKEYETETIDAIDTSEEGVATAEIQPHTLRDWFEPLDLIQQELLAFIINKLIISADGGKSGANTDHEGDDENDSNEGDSDDDLSENENSDETERTFRSADAECVDGAMELFVLLQTTTTTHSDDYEEFQKLLTLAYNLVTTLSQQLLEVILRPLDAEARSNVSDENFVTFIRLLVVLYVTTASNPLAMSDPQGQLVIKLLGQPIVLDTIPYDLCVSQQQLDVVFAQINLTLLRQEFLNTVAVSSALNHIGRPSTLVNVHVLIQTFFSLGQYQHWGDAFANRGETFSVAVQVTDNESSTSDSGYVPSIPFCSTEALRLAMFYLENPLTVSSNTLESEDDPFQVTCGATQATGDTSISESNDDCQTGGSSPSHDRVEQFVLAAPPPTDGAIIGSSNNMATPDAVNEKYLHDHCLGIFQHFRSESPPTPVHHQPDDVTENDCEDSL